jgi:hypothetical protein
MKLKTAKMRQLWVGIIVLFWLAVGVAMPFIFDFFGDENLLDTTGVVAAPRDRFQITDTFSLDKFARSTVSGGTLALVSPKGTNPLSAEDAAELLNGGGALLLLSNSVITVGASDMTASTEKAQIKAPLITALQNGTFKAVGVHAGTIVITTPSGNRERLTKVNGRILPGSSSTQVQGEGFWRGQRTKFSLTAGWPDSSGAVPVEIEFNATLLEFSYEGSVQLADDHRMNGKARIHLKDTEKLANALGTSWPIGTTLQNIVLEGPMRWEKNLLAFDEARVAVADNVAQGTVSLNMAAGQELISSTLAFGTLDVSPYLPNRFSGQVVLPWQWWTKLVATLSQPASPHLNADIRLSTKVLSSGEQTLGPAAATISMKNGKLSADVAEMTLNGGKATGQVVVDFNRYIPKLTVRGQIENIAIGKWCEAFAGKRYVEGNGRMVADLTSQGANIEQIIGELSGKVEFAMEEGGVIGVSLGELNSAQERQGAQTNQEVMARVMLGSTQMSSIMAIWKIKDGVASLVEGSGSHPTGQLLISGSYDLLQRTSDFRLLSLIGVKKKADNAALDGKVAPQSRSLVQTPPSAVLLTVKSNVGTGEGKGEPSLRLRYLIGPLQELERFLGPDYAKLPRRGL